MARFNNRRNDLRIEQQVGRVKAKMVNLAERSSNACVAVLREYAHKIKTRAAWYAPEETGALGDQKNWMVEEKRTGKNGRLTFTVKMRPGVRRISGSRSVPVSRYAKHMHNNEYTIRGFDKMGREINSRAKANRTPPAGQKRLSKYPTGAGNYVGRLFLTRAVNQYRLITLEKLREAVAKELK